MAWYICYDKETNEVRRVIELSSQDKANAISKYRISEPFKDKPDVVVVPEPIIPVAKKTEKEIILDILGIGEEDLINIKKISDIEKSVNELKSKGEING